MKKLFMYTGMLSGTLCGLSPLFLVLGLRANDLGRFFHNWFIFVLTTLIVTMVSLVAMQMVDN